MNATYRLLADGGFVAGDRATGRTAYAYPTSPNAEAARKAPLTVAREMLAESNVIAQTPVWGRQQDYDSRNWLLLAGCRHQLDTAGYCRSCGMLVVEVA